MYPLLTFAISVLSLIAGVWFITGVANLFLPYSLQDSRGFKPKVILLLIGIGLGVAGVHLNEPERPITVNWSDLP